MKLKDLKEAVDHLIENGHADDNVVVTVRLRKATCGARPSVNVANIYAGFDWEMHQVRIETTEDLYIDERETNR